jgi:hypothetical protein
MISLKRSQTANGGGGFTFVVSGGKKYIAPAWIEVPMETDFSDVSVEERPKVEEGLKLEDKEWSFTGSKGNLYTVSRIDGGYTCTCPAANFQRHKDCKHIVEVKFQEKTNPQK